MSCTSGSISAENRTLSGSGVASAAGAQHAGDGYPSKPITVVIPLAAGGAFSPVAVRLETYM